VSNCPVALLVDTGAGVSLMCWPIWDKINGNEAQVKLVSVDGNPIKVNGSAVISFAVAGLSF